MAWTAPPTYTTGQIVTAADLNTDLRDNMIVLRGTPNFFAHSTGGTGGTLPGGLYGAPYRMDGAADSCGGQEQVPRDFVSLTGAYAMVYGNAVGTIDWTVAGSIQKDAQAVATDTDSTTADTHALADATIDEIDVTAAYDGLTIAANNIITFSFTVDALDTITVLLVYGVRFHYA